MTFDANPNTPQQRTPSGLASGSRRAGRVPGKVDADGFVPKRHRQGVNVKVNGGVRAQVQVKVNVVRVLAVILLSLAACGSKKRQSRTTDAAPVEPITAPPPGDAGSTAKGSTDEVEPNDTEDTAMELGLGASIHGRIDPVDTDADAFRIDVTAPSVLSIEVGGVQQTDLVLELHDPGGVVVAKSDRGLANIKEAIPNFAVSKGRYTAVVKGKKVLFKGKPLKPAPPIVPYEITASLVKAPANAEHEPNDDRGTANDLIVGDPVTGFAGWTGDADAWKLALEALSAKNTIDIEIGAVEGIALTLELSDAVGKPLLTRKGPRGGALNVRGLLPDVPAGAPPFYYLTVKGNPSNPETAYALRVVPKNLENDAEVEPNDTIDKPMAIPDDRTRVDAQWSPGDIDCFAISPEGGNRTVEVSVEPPAEADLSAELVVDGKVIAKSETKGKGVGEKLKGAVPANARAIIRVWGSDNGGEGTYEVKVVDK